MNLRLFLIFCLCYWTVVNCQTENSSCVITSGGLAGVIFGCIIGTVVLTLLSIFLIWRHFYGKNNLSGLTADQFCYDNPDFKEIDRKAPNRENQTDDKRLEKTSSRISRTTNDIGYRTRKKRPSSNYGTWWKANNRDSECYQSTESLGSVSEYVRVPLISKDFTGLGFGIYGNIRDGIFIKNLLSRGPAKEGGEIREGDRIISVEVNFQNMAFEDALTILSYASPYPVTLEIQKFQNIKQPVQTFRSSRNYNSDRRAQFHPLVKSQSINEITALNSFRSSPVNTLERKSKSVYYSNLRPKSMEKEKPSAQVSPLEVVVEKKECEPLTKMLIRKLSECKNSQSSLESMGQTMENRQVVVTAEISEPPKETEPPLVKPARKRSKSKAPEIPTKDFYSDLSYEEKLQIMRLSYEDPEMSQSTPNLSRPSSDTEDIGIQGSKRFSDLNNCSKSTLPTSQDYQLNKEKIFSSKLSNFHPTNAQYVVNPIFNDSTESVNEIPMEFNKEQYDKLMYFQNQLARQQEELAQLGITIPTLTNNNNYATKFVKSKINCD